MHALKYLTAIWAFVYSCVCFALSQNTSFDSRFSDDLLVLIIFSGLVAGGVILDIKSDIFNYAKAIISFWFPVSAIFHWLTINEWTRWNIYYSMLFIAASVLFSFTQLSDCFERNNLPVFHYIYLPMVVVFILSVLDMHYNDNALSSMCMTVYVFVMLSQSACHWFPRKDSASPNEGEYINIWPSYSAKFFKFLCLILLASVFYSAASFFVNINLLTKLTRPSAFYYVTDTLIPLPGLMWLAFCSFDSLKVSYKVKNTLLFVQSALVAVRVFFNLRPEYFDFLFAETDTQIGILALLFYVTIYCYYAFKTSKIAPILIGTVYLMIACSGFIFGSYPLDEMSVTMLISVFTFICTVVDDYIADRNFEREMDNLLNHIRSTWKTVSDDELDCIDKDV